MKTCSNQSRIIFALICCAGLAAPSAAVAQENPSTDRASQRNMTEAEKVRVTRASNYLGSDVMSSDDRKVGDIVDYYFDVGSEPRVGYVVVMTGGFLNLGGDARAIPASAISSEGDTVRINISSKEYWDVPVLPDNRKRFLTDPQNRQRISQMFREGDQTAATSSGAEQQTTASSGSTAATSSDDPNRAGAPTGRAQRQQSGQQQMDTRLVSFTELTNADAYGQQDDRIGYFADAWINLNDDRVPYVEVTPTFNPFRTSLDRRYAIPTAKLGQKGEGFGYKVKVTSDELREAEPVSEAEGVKMLEEGRFGDTVLRVTVPER